MTSKEVHSPERMFFNIVLLELLVISTSRMSRCMQIYSVTSERLVIDGISDGLSRHCCGMRLRRLAFLRLAAASHPMAVFCDGAQPESLGNDTRADGGSRRGYWAFAVSKRRIKKRREIRRVV